jgi:branched-chain amino acid transport system ATP-binding protein
MLEIKDLTVRYGTTTAVHELSLSLGEASALALLGANGAGKTSSLRAISGLTPATGSVRFDGAEMLGLRPEVIARRGLIHCPEGRQVFGDLTVQENLEVGATAAGGRQQPFRIDEVYDLFPALVRLRDRLGYALSGGEQQMVALGRALVARPRVLMIDEPSLGLAPQVCTTVTAALLEVKARTVLIVVEQNVSVALEICDQAVVVAEGRTVMSGAASELRDRSAILASYLGQRRTGVGSP